MRLRIVYISVMLTAGTPAGGGPRRTADGGTPRRVTDRRTPRRALRYRGVYIRAYAMGEGGYGGGLIGEAGKVYVSAGQ